MAAVEADARERAKRRADQRERATREKERANQFFKAGDWKRAADLYTEAIKLSKDWEVLYTNRAQVSVVGGAWCQMERLCIPIIIIVIMIKSIQWYTLTLY